MPQGPKAALRRFLLISALIIRSVFAFCVLFFLLLVVIIVFAIQVLEL